MFKYFSPNFFVNYFKNFCLVINRRSSSKTIENHGFNFSLTEYQNRIIEKAENFTKENIIPKSSFYDRTGQFPWDIVKSAHSFGLMTMFAPKKYGGNGSTLLDYCLMTETVSYGCIGIAAAVIFNILAQTPIINYGSEQQKQEYLGRCVSDPILAAYCMTEPGAGSDAAAIQTRAEKNSDGDWVLNGRKMWITNGGIANWYFVLARTHQKAKTREAFSGFIVDANSPGVFPLKKELNMGFKCLDNRAVIFENVIVPKKNLVGEEGKGFRVVMGAVDTTRPVVAAMATGLANRSLYESTKYCLEREVPILLDQANQFMLADMAIGVETSRLALLRAAWMYDIGKPNTYWASIAKCLASDFANIAAANAVQLFGKDGLNSDYPVEKLMRDAKLLQIIEGTSQIQKIIIARQHLAQAELRNNLAGSQPIYCY